PGGVQAGLRSRDDAAARVVVRGRVRHRGPDRASHGRGPAPPPPGRRSVRLQDLRRRPHAQLLVRHSLALALTITAFGSGLDGSIVVLIEESTTSHSLTNDQTSSPQPGRTDVVDGEG